MPVREVALWITMFEYSFASCLNISVLPYAYTYVEKAPDDLTPKTKENLTLEELMKTWMAKMEDNCLFISAREKINIDELKSVVYQRVKELHVQKYPYNDFLYQTYDDEE